MTVPGRSRRGRQRELGPRVRGAAGIAAALALMFAAAPARAERPEPPEPYGWQILAVDAAAAAAGLAVGALSTRGADRKPADGIVNAWAVGMAGSLALHGHHQQYGHAGASLGVRLALPPLAAGIGLLGTSDGNLARFPTEGGRWGFVAGMAGASLVDIVATDVGGLSRPEPTDWYGAPIVAIDVASLAALGTVMAVNAPREDKANPLLTAAPTFLIGGLTGPAVHLVRGNVGTALGSAAMRLGGSGLFSIAGITGYCAASGGASGCTAHGALMGLGLGAALTAVIDGLILARDPAPREEPTAQVVPYVAPSADGIYAGLSFTR